MMDKITVCMLNFVYHLLQYVCVSLITEDNAVLLLPLAEEYQMDKITCRCEEHLLNGASTVKSYLIAQQYNLKRLLESNLSYLKRAPVSR